MTTESATKPADDNTSSTPKDDTGPPWLPPNKCRYLAEQAAAGSPVPAKTYAGGCHCGAIAFDVTLQPPLEAGHTVVECSCSVCRRLGYLLVYPTRENVCFQRGQEKCSKYQFNQRVQDHLFCTRCGTSLMIDFRDRFRPAGFDGYGVNVRVLRDVDLDRLTIEKTDGATLVLPAEDTSGRWYEGE